MGHEPAKALVHDFWNDASCGEDLLLHGTTPDAYAEHARSRYALEPWIPAFARFDQGRGRRVLEIGVGLGADHQRWAESGADLYGVDLTERAVAHTTARLAALGFTPRVTVGDAEHLTFPDGFFDLVYSWGVIHHNPDTGRAVAEILRVLKPGGVARIMIYSKWSLVGLMLWARYALLAGRPLTPLREIYSRHLESPGTKAYTMSEARALFSAFTDVRISTVLTHADLLESAAGQRHEGAALAFARRVWPRALLRRFARRMGLFMMIEARKPA